MSTRPPAKKTAPVKKAPAAKKAVVAKNAAAPAPAPVVIVVAPEPKHKAKDKLVRDSFTMPRSDFELIALLKERALTFKRPTKKSELLRAGLQALAALNQKQLQTALDRLPLLKSGRPKKLPPAAKAIGVE
jgi:hypothetical protein